MFAAIGLTLSLALGDGLPSALFIEESWAIAWADLFSAESAHLYGTASSLPDVNLPALGKACAFTIHT